MLEKFTMEFWMISQVVMDVVLILVVFLVWRKISKGPEIPKEAALMAISRVLEPVLDEARKLADTFDGHLNEKRAIINKINHDLDSRIISLNLLLKRAEGLMAQQKSPGQGDTNVQSDHVVDLQQKVVALDAKGMKPEEIATRLHMPRGEVDMVISLKRKFEKMGEA
ncbi:MAG: hypothetical protein JEZ02_15490 [Desulfatibacillum sp.]|nr:hypothetical protein [Desulfatibacillum sp.]